jgi:SAM-dependent methyltransferase
MDLVERSALLGRRHPWEVARARIFLRLLERLEVRATTGAWLDVGAGDAWFARQLRAVVPDRARVACWDVHYGDAGPPADPDDIAAAEGAEANGSGPALEFSARRPEGVFDGVPLLDVVEHVEDDVGFLRAVVADSLAPGGWVLVSVPAYQSLFSDHDRFLRHERRYSPGAIRAVVEGAGLRVQARGGLFHSLLPVRVAQVGRERARHRPAAAGHGPEGIGAWHGGRLLSRALVAGLGCDTALSLALATRHTPVVPGLSTWVFCQRAEVGR